jgi:RNA polymerase sigma-70 factor (ECF subfamily)
MHGLGRAEDERQLLLACRKGDQAACARLVRAYQDLALRTAFLMTSDPQAAEDVAQNAFLNAFRHLNGFDLERPFKPWFLAILANEARMFLRAQRRRPVVALDNVGGDIDRLARRTDELLTRLVRDDQRSRVRKALADLDEPFRTTAILYYFNDLSIDEIAVALRCQPGTVKSRLHEARQRLRPTLAPLVESHDTPAAAGAWRMMR